jgi:hypothetical protein
LKKLLVQFTAYTRASTLRVGRLKNLVLWQLPALKLFVQDGGDSFVSVSM